MLPSHVIVQLVRKRSSAHSGYVVWSRIGSNWEFCEPMKGFDNGGSHEVTEDVGM